MAKYYSVAFLCVLFSCAAVFTADEDETNRVGKRARTRSTSICCEEDFFKDPVAVVEAGDSATKESFLVSDVAIPTNTGSIFHCMCSLSTTINDVCDEYAARNPGYNATAWAEGMTIDNAALVVHFTKYGGILLKVEKSDSGPVR